MAGGFHLYYEAARALWEMKTSRLETMAREDRDPARRRAATLTLRLKADFVTPEEYGDERSSVTKLAAALSEDPGFGMDAALGMGGPARTRSAPVLFQSGIARPSGRSRMMWVAITAAVILLVLDVLATAGVPVPTPIGELIDRFSGSDESPVQRPSRESRIDHVRRPERTEAAAFTQPEPRATTPVARHALRADAEEGRDEAGARRPESGTRQARGRALHQAQGRALHQAQGRESHRTQGRALHQAQGRESHRAQGREKRPRMLGHRKGTRRKDLRE